MMKSGKLEWILTVEEMSIWNDFKYHFPEKYKSLMRCYSSPRLLSSSRSFVIVIISIITRISIISTRILVLLNIY